MKLQWLTQFSRQVMLCTLVLATLLTYWSSAAWAQAATDLPCDQTPFGHTLAIGQENEIFVGLRNADTVDPGRLTADDWSFERLEPRCLKPATSGSCRPTAQARPI